MRLRRWSRRRIAIIALALAGLASGAYAVCRKNVYVPGPDGEPQLCEWYCTLSSGGVIYSGCS